MSPVDLAVLIAEAAPFGEDLAAEIELQDLATIGRAWLQIAAVYNVKKIVGADGEGPRAAAVGGGPFIEEFAASVKNLDARVVAVCDVNLALRVHGYAVGQVEFAEARALLAPIELELAVRG